MHWDVEADKASLTWDYEDCACGVADDAYAADVRCEYSVSEFFGRIGLRHLRKSLIGSTSITPLYLYVR
jgi:hypothetical protein